MWYCVKRFARGCGTKGELVRSKKVKNIIDNDLVAIAVAGSWEPRYNVCIMRQRRACLQNAVAFDRKYFPGYIGILCTWHGSSLKDLSPIGRDLVHRKITVLFRRLENVPDPSNLPRQISYRSRVVFDATFRDRDHCRTIFNASSTASEGNVRFQVCPEEAGWRVPRSKRRNELRRIVLITRLWAENNHKYVEQHWR